MSRMSNTAEILTKQFRQQHIRKQSDDNIIHTTNNDDDDDGDDDVQWSWKRFIQEFFCLNQQMSSKDSDDEMNELFWKKYLKKLQINFFVWLLLLNTFFNIITIIVALYHQNDSKFFGTIFLYFASLIVFGMFLFITFIDEHLLQPEFSSSLASITVLITMIFTEYGYEFFHMNHLSTISMQRIRPLYYILIANNLLLPFSSRMSAAISSIIIITIEIIISIHHRLNICQIQNIIRLTFSEIIVYVYTALFGLYIKGLLEKNIRRAFENYIESKYNIYQVQKEQEQILKSCLPKHLIDRVRKDLKEVIDQQGRVVSRRFQKLYIKKYDNVSILFADIVNSVTLTASLNANELVETLDDMFGTFDKCADKNNCLRIKLLGDCYYCVSGLPIPDSNHAWNCVRMGIDMIKIINEIRKSKNIDINMRIGINSGMVQSGIIGMHKWQFDIWSMDCLLASQMEQDGVPGCVHITKKTYDLLPKDKLSEYNIVEKITNENIGYLISMTNSQQQQQQQQRKSNRKISLINELSLVEDHQNEEKVFEVSNENFIKEMNVCKIQMRSSFSTIHSIKRINSSNQNNELEKCLERKRMFIDQEIEKMPLSFKKKFKNFHGINPISLTFVKQSNNQQQESEAAAASAREEDDDDDDDDDGDDDEKEECFMKKDSKENSLKLEKEFLTLPDEFFIFHLFFSIFLCLIIGLNKVVIIPNWNDTQWISLTLLGVTLIIILLSFYYSYRNSNTKLTFCKRNFIWLIVNLLLLANSLQDLILYNCKMEQKEMIIQTVLKQFDSANCPYIWNLTMCTILSMTGISIFITINFWFKFILRSIGLFCFIAILLNDCSLYQSIIPRIENEKQWISNIGFDPIMSHLYYMVMAFIILTIIDREIEYVFRLEFRIRKNEKQDGKITVEINEILLKNILPTTYIVREYLKNNSRSNKKFYSESYRFCAVMFASIPNYSEFYSENEINQHGKNCLKLLNEIICDFDVLLSCPEFQKIEKIKTIGSTYMAAAGLQPGRLSIESDYDDNDSRSIDDERKLVKNLICFAMELMKKLREMNKNAFQDLKLRIGIAVGPVIAGIVGKSKPQYDIWGDTVNVASRMESTGVMGRIQITQETANIIFINDDYENIFTLEKRGPIPVKGKGNLITYLAKTEFDFDEQDISL
ncbi:adenylate cyclase type 2-like [Dermatophagoides farinae]|uniref:adenylate cyclase type 2-like n=1 Tax=Dermatophagoides farinae TaxID=6954 RepID=UPI003F636F42